mmetsp:Transcript_17157/g.28165  ORF Transcript_17157/g.28165 Transcript_17157/m.28165 type:complete len:89 (-) Transcript_17157:54-320(-)
MSFLLSADQSILLDFLSELYIGYAEQCAAEDFIFYRLFLVSSFVGSDKTLLDWEKCMQNKVKLLDIGQKTEKNLGSVRRSSFLAGASE